MTRYERAKYIASFATVTKSGLSILRPLSKYPYLEDKECKKLAKETLYSYKDISEEFPTIDQWLEQQGIQ